MFDLALKNEFNIFDYFRRKKYLKEFAKTHPNYFSPIGTCIFCGSQGSGKTLSSVLYVTNILKEFPYCVLVTNVTIKGYDFNCKYKIDNNGNSYLCSLVDENRIYNVDKNGNHNIQGLVVEYDGLDCLKYVSNGWQGVIYLIDELHLELNSLESKNIDIDVMTEISQQRKQRKHIVGTSQVYMRLAKPLREQIFDVVICQNFFKFIQFNKLIDGEQSKEVDGKLDAVVKSRHFFTHKVEYYQMYDTFAKMKRYNKEWKGHKREQNIYVSNSNISNNYIKRGIKR